MTGLFFLDWAVMAVSLFNTIVLLWLGLTVLLNAGGKIHPWRKGWGIWLAGGGLILGGAFFISHSAILGRDMRTISQGVNFWWYMGWGPVILLPLAWYAIMLWYAGFWNDRTAGRPSRLRRRHRIWLGATWALSALLVGMLLFGSSLPSFNQVAVLDLSAVPVLAGVPILFLAYPFYSLLCIVLSLDALSCLAPSGEAIKDLARRRARPWLFATAALLFLVSLLVGGVLAWIVLVARQCVASEFGLMVIAIGWLDLVIASLIGLSVVLLGRAVVAYEVFTGETLPRRGFARYWRNALILAAGYGVVVGGSLVAQSRPIYVLLLATVLLVTFYALLSWRSFAERERYMAYLRPFVGGPRLYESLLSPRLESLEVDVGPLLHALCEDVLGAESACLMALGPLAPLIGHSLIYPEHRAVPSFSLTEIVSRFDGPMEAPLEPSACDGFVWAVSLWAPSGLIGVLLLGEKRDGGLYTREEMEIARISGERLVDTQATAEMSRRLMALLRQRIAQVKVLEGQGRRVLHDQVLPHLHTALLYLSGLPGDPAVQQAMDALTMAHRQISDLMRDTAPAAPQQLIQQGLAAALRMVVDRDFASNFSQVTWRVDPKAAQAADGLPLYASEAVLFAAQELIRNAARHGRGSDPQRPLQLSISLEMQDDLRLVVEDNGVGFARTAEGRGNGLQFHSAMLAAVGGNIQVGNILSGGARAVISLSLDVLKESLRMFDRPA